MHLKALACPKGPLLQRTGPAGNVKRMVKHLVGQGRKAAESVVRREGGGARAAARGAAGAAGAGAMAEAGASFLRVILAGIRAGFAKVTGWRRILRRGPARVGRAAAAPAA